MDTTYKLSLDGQDWCYTSIKEDEAKLRSTLEELNKQRIDEFVVALRSK